MVLLLVMLILPGCASGGTIQSATAQLKPWSPGNYSFTINAGEHNRRYTVHVPPSYDGKTFVPVVIMLHGGGGTGKAAPCLGS